MFYRIAKLRILMQNWLFHKSLKAYKIDLKLILKPSKNELIYSKSEELKKLMGNFTPVIARNDL